MALRLFDSYTGQVRDFVPLAEGKVGVYVCGATPQSSPHLGHVRAQVSFDVLRRWLIANGHEVTYVRNVTDIDDKILTKSAEQGRPWWAHAFLFEREFSAAYEALNVLPPTIEPRATGHIIEMTELIGRLIDSGHAYPAPDESGDVYFDVASFGDYGALTHQKPSDMEAAADADPNARKRSPQDFALWKGHKPGEPETASWPTPWGPGRPGWHLECSAMATRYLGPEFDIHGGGLDLRFPHHENELAQSRAAGDGFARYWLHNGLVTAAGEKMSKSLGNGMTMGQLFADGVRPVVLRYLLAAPHFRSNLEVGPQTMAETTAAYERVEGFALRAAERLGEPAVELGPVRRASVPEAFAAAMDDDLGVPAALAVLHDTVRDGNKALADNDEAALPTVLRQVRAMASILGVDPLDRHWTRRDSSVQPHERSILGVLIRAQLDRRAQARKDRDFATADEIRRTLTSFGVQVEDTPEGARWTLENDHAR